MEAIEWLLSNARQAFDLLREYRVEFVVTGNALLNPLFTALAVQRFKRLAPTLIGRLLRDSELRLLAMLVSLGLTVMVCGQWAGLSVGDLIVWGVLVMLGSPLLFKWYLAHCKANKPDRYAVLRNNLSDPIATDTVTPSNDPTLYQ